MSSLDAILAGEQPETYWPDLFPPRLSPSSVALAASCPEKWRRKYIQDMREPWGGAAIVGLAVHRSAEVNFEQKVESHEDLPVEDAREIAAQSFEDKVLEAEKDGIDWRDLKRGDAKDQSVQLAGLYHRVGAPRVQPVAVEEWVEAQLPGVPELYGRVDVRTEDRIPDIKTTGRMMREPRGDWRLKGMLYSRMTGLGVEWHVVTKTKTPAVYTSHDFPGLHLPATPLLHKVAERRVQTTVASLTDLLDRYGPDEAWPTNAPEHEWLCGYCGHRQTCSWWVG